jgi:hypothetical protein
LTQPDQLLTKKQKFGSGDIIATTLIYPLDDQGCMTVQHPPKRQFGAPDERRTTHGAAVSPQRKLTNPGSSGSIYDDRYGEVV